MAIDMNEELQNLITLGKTQISDIGEQHKRDIEQLKLGHKKELGEIRELLNKKFEVELESVKSKSRNAVVAVLSAVLIGFIIFFYNASSDISSKTNSVNQSVLSLQSGIITARTAVSSIHSDLDFLKVSAQKKIEESRLAYEKSESALNAATTALKGAETALNETKEIYLSRLREMNSQNGNKQNLPNK